MCFSSDLPPAGFTRAEPSPPVRRRAFRSPRVAVIAATLVLGAGLVVSVGYGTTWTAPVRSVVPDAATPSPSSGPSSAPASGRPGAEPDGVSAGGSASPKQAPGRGHSARRPEHRRPAVPRRPRKRPPVTHKAHKPHKPHTARPAPPSWITSECRRRFPRDPVRRGACVAVLKGRFGG